MVWRNVEVVHGVGTDAGIRFEQISASHHALVAALYSKAIDIWKSPRGIQVCRSYLRFWFHYTAAYDLHEARCAFFIPKFLQLIEARSPLLIITSRGEDTLTGFHQRNPWAGHHDGFDSRTQHIALSKSMIDHIIDLRLRALMFPNEQTKRDCHLAAFKAIVTIAHELAHVFGTYVGQGILTPDTMHGVYGARDMSMQPANSPGEAGEFFERGLFGGEFSFQQDHLHRGQPQAPYLVTTQSLTWQRADAASIQQLLEGPVPQRADLPLIRVDRRNDPRNNLDAALALATHAGVDLGQEPRLSIADGCGYAAGTGASKELAAALNAKLAEEQRAGRFRLPSPMPIFPGVPYWSEYLRATIARPY